MERRKAEGRRNARRVKVVRLVADVMEAGRLLSKGPGKRWVAGGAKRSESEPVRSRARVEVSAMVLTWVDGRPAGDEAFVIFDTGVRDWTIVPS